MIKRTLDEWLEWQEKLHLSEIDLGLERIRKVAKNLGLLSPAFPIITVAGTNGKGSSVAMLDAILNAQGYKTGNYTSPHLIEYNERIKLNGNNADDALIITAFEQIDEARGNISLTYFEFGTLAAMLIFSQQKVDIGILEVGLGGRLDAANLWDTSLAIISSIDIDHIDWLGDDREIIGTEKSGIMRKQVAAICGDPKPPKSIRNEAQRIGAHLFQINKDFSFQKVSADKWIWHGWGKQLSLPTPSLGGEFQLNNAATIIAGLQAISALLPVSDDAIKQGLIQAQAPGRLQTIHTAPEWLIDVAHNPHAAKALAKHLHKNSVSGKTYALFSMLKDKDIEQVITIMDKYIDEWHIIALQGSRGMSINELKQQIGHQTLKGRVVFHNTLEDACKTLKNISNIQDRVVAFGSFLVVSEVIASCH